MKKILTTGTLIISLVLLFTQNSKAQYVINEADEQYYLFNYTKAIDLYSQAYKKRPTLRAAQQLASCYRLTHDYKNAESWYAIVVAMPESQPENILKYAEALQNNSKYSEAKEQYVKYLSLNLEQNTDKVKKLVMSCDSAIKWMKNPVWVNIVNEKALNTAQSDWGSVKYGNSIVFSSDRTNTSKEAGGEKKKPFLKFDGGDISPSTKVYGWTGNDYLRLYQFDGNAAKLFPINTGTEYHIGAATFTADGNEMYFTLTRIHSKAKEDKKGTKTINIEIYSSVKEKGSDTWSKPVAFAYNNSELWSAGDPFITPDGKKLYFVSDMEGGKGGTDIYYCNRNTAGGWDLPVNITSINTEGNERTPYVGPGNDFYFASDGGIGMGGLDIFKATYSGNIYSDVQNLGYPVNSPQDDFAYSLTAPKTGYLSSERIGGAGSDDIYSFSEKIKPVYALRLEGTALDKTNQTALANTIVTFGKTNGATPLKVQTDETGKYKFDLESGNIYQLTGEKTGYRGDFEEVTTEGLTASTVIRKDLFLNPIVLNKEIKLENIYYDLNKSDIRPDAAVELNKLIKILKDNPTIWIELGSHTDSRASDAYNMALSQRRADAAVKYIVTVGGIDRNRITAKGYGETRLVNGCSNGVSCTIQQHQQNRRTEFKIVKQ
ncbi:MAG: OmpA family protein [Mucilaginibacter sp.]